jgi:anti-sigma factor RsiW
MKDTPPLSQHRQGYHIMRWKADGMEYWAASELAANDLERFAKELRVMAHQ